MTLLLGTLSVLLPPHLHYFLRQWHSAAVEAAARGHRKDWVLGLLAGSPSDSC